MADALHLALDTGKGSAENAYTAVLLVDEVAIGQGNALVVGVWTGGRIDESLHLAVGNPENAGLLLGVERLHVPELHGGAGAAELLEQLQLDFHGLYEDDVKERRRGLRELPAV